MRMETNTLPEENLLAIDKGDLGVVLWTNREQILAPASGLVGDSVANSDL